MGITINPNAALVKDSASASSAIPSAEKGQAGGVATLDNMGKVPSAQLPAAPQTSGGGGESSNVSPAVVWDYDPSLNSQPELPDAVGPFTPNTQYIDDVMTLTGTAQSAIVEFSKGVLHYVALKTTAVEKTTFKISSPNASLKSTLIAAIPPNVQLSDVLSKFILTPSYPRTLIYNTINSSTGRTFFGGVSKILSPEPDTGAEYVDFIGRDYSIKVSNYFDFYMEAGEFEGETPEDIEAMRAELETYKAIILYQEVPNGNPEPLTAFGLDTSCTDLYIVMSNDFANVIESAGSEDELQGDEQVTVHASREGIKYNLPTGAKDFDILKILSDVTLFGTPLKSGDFFQLYGGLSKGIPFRQDAYISSLSAPASGGGESSELTATAILGLTYRGYMDDSQLGYLDNLISGQTATTREPDGNGGYIYRSRTYDENLGWV